ncbi:MAG: bifunctional 3-deoxy-7-phosphoheptulonate synthase/chorismate mutase type II [Bacteroidota bacterium]
MIDLQFQPLFDRPQQRPLRIAGPCSAESEEQVLRAARALAQQDIDLFRAGIWKPRTRPNSFEGVGTVGLKWLRRVKAETGLKVTTEVAKRDHVFEALKYGVDVLWIGARTTVNPFAVQEIADALDGVDIPVLIKNPINPDLGLWIGAIERIYKAGITRIGVVHRGFSSHRPSRYRNEPHWNLAIELMRQLPGMTYLCDNSHICGNRELLTEVAQKAMDLNFTGLMTEVHPDPDAAWSDAKQQITPSGYAALLAELTIRDQTSDDPVFLHNIEDLRGEIDQLDEELLNLLGQRMQVAEKIGEYKKQNNISILQPSRWNELLEEAFTRGAQHGLSKGFIGKLLSAVHQESISHQEVVMNRKTVRVRP